MEIRLEQLEAVHWTWLVLGAVVLMTVAVRSRRRALHRFADETLTPFLIPVVSRVREYGRAMLIGLAGLFLVLALMDPRWGVTYQDVPQRGVDVMIVLDVSRSMLAEDVQPTRLGRAKQFAADLVEQLAGDRVGLVAFAGSSALRCPLTVDYGAFRMALETTEVFSEQRGGSMLGDALRVAADSFTDDLPDHKAIIVFTDGEDHGSYPREAAQTIAESKSIPVHVVGIGDADQGARIPVRQDGQTLYLMYEGQQVWSVMDAETLREIALASGGLFIPAGTGRADMSAIYEEHIAPMARREFDTARIRRYNVQYQWFAGAALVLLLFESWMSVRRRRHVATITEESTS